MLDAYTQAPESLPCHVLDHRGSILGSHLICVLQAPGNKTMWSPRSSVPWKVLPTAALALLPTSHRTLQKPLASCKSSRKKQLGHPLCCTTACVETTQHCKVASTPHAYSEQENPRTSKTICAPLCHSLWDHLYSQGTK